MKEAKHESIENDLSYIKCKTKQNQVVVLGGRPVVTWARRQEQTLGGEVSQSFQGDGDILLLDLSKYWSHGYIHPSAILEGIDSNSTMAFVLQIFFYPPHF